MVQRVLLCLSLLALTGCATMATRQTCSFTSNPPGASIYAVDSPDAQAPGKLLGTTPLQKWVPQGIAPGYLRAEKSGYEPVVWPVPSALRYSHHFDLERELSAQVAAELDHYPKPYVRAAVEVLGACDQALASSRRLSPAAAAAANTANEKLKLDFADLKGTALAHALDQTVDAVRLACGTRAQDFESPGETRATAQAQHLIDQTRQGLGLR